MTDSAVHKNEVSIVGKFLAALCQWSCFIHDFFGNGRLASLANRDCNWSIELLSNFNRFLRILLLRLQLSCAPTPKW